MLTDSPGSSFSNRSESFDLNRTWSGICRRVCRARVPCSPGERRNPRALLQQQRCEPFRRIRTRAPPPLDPPVGVCGGRGTMDGELDEGTDCHVASLLAMTGDGVLTMTGTRQGGRQRSCLRGNDGGRRGFSPHVPSARYLLTITFYLFPVPRFRFASLRFPG